jgi:hypothetical protein
MTKLFQIEHITITTGASRISHRSETSPQVIAHIQDVIRRAVTPLAMIDNDWTIRPVRGTPEGTHVWDLLWRGERIVACWLCTSRAISDQLWDVASRSGAMPGARLHRPMMVPWLAATLCHRPEIMTEPEFTRALGEVGDIERCIAWATIDGEQT